MPNNNKAFNINTLCELRGIDSNSEEAVAMKEWTVLQLLNAIKEERDNRKRKPEPEPEVVEEDDISLSSRVGCSY